MRRCVSALVCLGLVSSCGNGPKPAQPTAGRAVTLAPFAMAIVIDRSGSMQGARLDAAKHAIETVATTLSSDDALAVIAFSTAAETWVPLAPIGTLTSLHDQLATRSAGGGTDLRRGLESALGVLSTSSAARKHVLVVSDGESNYDGVEELVDRAAASGVTISAIGLGDADAALLEIITNHGHGRLAHACRPRWLCSDRGR